MNLPASAYRQTEAVRWQNEYHQHMRQRLHVTLKYVRQSPSSRLRAHLRSLLITLDEARRYPDLTPLILDVIAALHPLPVRWGFGYLWQSHLSFSLQQEECRPDQRAVYHNALSEIHFFSGTFDEAIVEASAVLALEDSPSIQKARAGHMLFNCLRSRAEPEKADQILGGLADEFHLHQNAHQIGKETAFGWLVLNQCQLELLREQGKTEEALRLVNDMLWLNEQIGNPDSTLTAGLTTHRSTMLWVQGSFQQAVDDLLRAIDLYRSEEDVFNAESLQSNLGLVYWSMGEFKKAEASLRSSIDFHRRTGAEQLITYDIGNMGLVHFARGHLQAALDSTREHIAHAEKLGFVSEYNRARRNLGTKLYYFGEYEQALVELNSNQDYYAEYGSREGYVIDFVWSACCYYQMGQKERALEDIRKVVAWSVANDSPVLEAVTRRSLAYFLPLEEKSPHLERCLALIQTQERQLEKAAVLLTMAQTLPPGEREQTWQEGADLLERIGAEAWLEGHSIEDPPYIPTMV